MDWMQGGTLKLEAKQLLQLIKVCLRNSGKLSTKTKLKERFEWKWAFLPKHLFIINNGIIFQSWWLPPYSFLTQEHCKLIIFYLTSTFFKSPSSNKLQSALWLILALGEYRKNVFWIFWISSNMEFGTVIIKDK